MGKLHFFTTRINGHDGCALDIPYACCIRRLDGLSEFDGEFGRSIENIHVGGFRKFHCACFRVNEFLARITTGIKPGPQGLRLADRPLKEADNSLVGNFQAVIRDGQNRGENFGFRLVENLDNVAVGLRIQNLEYISTGGQNAFTLTVNAGNLNWTAKSDNRFLVPGVGIGTRCEHHAHHCHATHCCRSFQ